MKELAEDDLKNSEVKISVLKIKTKQGVHLAEFDEELLESLDKVLAVSVRELVTETSFKIYNCSLSSWSIKMSA